MRPDVENTKELRKILREPDVKRKRKKQAKISKTITMRPKDKEMKKRVSLRLPRRRLTSSRNNLRMRRTQPSRTRLEERSKLPKQVTTMSRPNSIPRMVNSNNLPSKRWKSSKREKEKKLKKLREQCTRQLKRRPKK